MLLLLLLTPPPPPLPRLLDDQRVASPHIAAWSAVYLQRKSSFSSIVGIKSTQKENRSK
jgi:hypothetical protein